MRYIYHHLSCPFRSKATRSTLEPTTCVIIPPHSAARVNRQELTAELKSIDSAACLRCCPMGDNGVFDDNEFNVGTVFVVNRRCTFALSDAVELGPCDCMRTPIGRSGGGTKGSSRGDRREFENVMAIFYRLAWRVSTGSGSDDRLWIFGATQSQKACER